MGALRVLNVVAVGLTLGAGVGAVFDLVDDGGFGMTSALTTFAVGTAWAALLRARKRVWSKRVPIGWPMSLLLAPLNAALAAGFLFGRLGHTTGFDLREAVTAAIAGATVGAVIWAPGLGLTLGFFGLPIHYARQLAERGLAGEEKGEKIVGLVCGAAGLTAMGLELERHGARDVPVLAMAALGLGTGVLATLLAWWREGRRRSFVARAEAGEIPGFRVEATPAGKALMRVSSSGDGYRVADFEEQVAELGEEGAVMRVRA